MTRACARFFAADWEALSFLEFFVDLQLRVAEDPSGGAGRTTERLADHSRFALQLTLVRSVDSYVAYLAEIAGVVANARRSSAWQGALIAQGLTKPNGPLGPNAPWGSSESSSVPVDVGLRWVATLAHGNIRRFDRLFADVTDIQLFTMPDELERIGRLASLRNLIAHGRIFAADDLAALVDETASVAGLGLRLVTFREDLKFLRVSVARVDESVASLWGIERPITSEQLFNAISAAVTGSSKASDVGKVTGHIEV